MASADDAMHNTQYRPENVRQITPLSRERFECEMVRRSGLVREAAMMIYFSCFAPSVFEALNQLYGAYIRGSLILQMDAPLWMEWAEAYVRCVRRAKVHKLRNDAFANLVRGTSGGKVVIEEATWGHPNDRTKQVDVTPELRVRVAATGGRLLKLTKGDDLCEMLGDPCPGFRKALQVRLHIPHLASKVTIPESHGFLRSDLNVLAPTVAPALVVLSARFSQEHGTAFADVTTAVQAMVDANGGYTLEFGTDVNLRSLFEEQVLRVAATMDPYIAGSSPRGSRSPRSPRSPRSSPRPARVPSPVPILKSGDKGVAAVSIVQTPTTPTTRAESGAEAATAATAAIAATAATAPVAGGGERGRGRGRDRDGSASPIAALTIAPGDMNAAEVARVLGRSVGLLLVIECRLEGKRAVFRGHARNTGLLKKRLFISAYTPIPAIHILHATYGSKRNRKRRGIHLGQMDVTLEVRERMRLRAGGTELHFRTEETLSLVFGDPAPGLQKELTLSYGFKERHEEFFFQTVRGHLRQDIVIGWPKLLDRTKPSTRAVLQRPFATDASFVSPAFFTAGGVASSTKQNVK
tara:strand:- start:173 stop:1909 length:1737 start_codon:yes stop_codon:yes gene_type:complete